MPAQAALPAGALQASAKKPFAAGKTTVLFSSGWPVPRSGEETVGA
ncbi:MAG TPA: hypothetical protein VNH15_01560 [Elusimicrobiota bacterium]|nr:hypothetical protein [Elusimicrobiota bacterium]